MSFPNRTLSKEPSLLILLLLVSFASVSAVLFTPALPEITQKLGISTKEAQLTMSIFLVGYALGNLPWGPVSNRFGRKRAAFFGILLAIVGSFLVVLVNFFQFFSLFVFGRFLMALGSSVGMKIAFTIIGDVYQGEKATKKIAHLSLSFAIGPAIAIALGGFLTSYYGWESCFYFLTGYSILLLFLTSLLPETAEKLDRQALSFSKVREGYRRKLKNRMLVTSALLMGCVTSFVYLFASEAPFIGIDVIGLQADTYGLLNFIPPVGMIAGSMLSHALAGKKEAPYAIMLGIAIMFFSSAAMFLLFLLGKISAWSLFLPMPFVYVGTSLVFSNSSALAMTHAKDKSNASAMMNFINLSITVIALFVIGSIPTSVFTLPVIFMVIAFLMVFLKNRLSHLLAQKSL